MLQLYSVTAENYKQENIPTHTHFAKKKNS